MRTHVLALLFFAALLVSLCVAASDSENDEIVITYKDGRTVTLTGARVTSRSILVKTGSGGYTIWAKELSDETLKRLGMTEELARREAQRKKEEFAREQKAKGLVKYGDRWVTAAEKRVLEAKDRARREARERERDYQRRAREIAMVKYRSNAAFEIMQPLERGSLCIMRSDGDVFFLIGLTRKVTGRGERYRGDLYWAGTYTYETVAGAEQTVNAYALDLRTATTVVRLKFGLFDKDGDAGSRDAPNGPKSSPTPRSFGSGFFVTADGYLLTNYHVVQGRAKIAAKTKDGEVEAKVVAKDPENDLALLKVAGRYVPVTFAGKSSERLGQTVFTVGFPMPELQGFEPKVTKGVISSVSGLNDDVRQFQIDAAVQPGNSGGPLADEEGNIVGVVVSRVSDRLVLETTGTLPQNINYAVKRPYILAFLETRPEVTAKVPGKPAGDKIPFEDAVQKVSKSVVLVVGY